MFNKYPYTDFHELNLDWFLEEFKKVTDKVTDLDATVQEFTQFVTNYFDNLDVQEEINKKLDELVADGTIASLLQPLVDAALSTVNNELNDQSAKITLLESRMDSFVHLTDGSTTGDAELADARIEYDGTTAATAGDAIRAQAEFCSDKASVLSDGKIISNNFTQYDRWDFMSIPSAANLPGIDITNVYSYLIASSLAGGTTRPIKIRDYEGNLLYDITFDNGSATSGMQAVFFDKDGRYDSYVQAPSFDPANLPATAYYVIVRIYENHSQKLFITPKTTIDIPDWFTVKNTPVKDYIVTNRVTTGYSIVEHYYDFYSLDNASFIARLQALNTSGTWSGNVYTSPNGGIITVNADNTITADNTLGSGTLAFWFPGFPMTAGDEIYLVTKSTARVSFYRGTTSILPQVDGVYKYTAGTTSPNYRFALRVAIGDSGTLDWLKAETELSVNERIDMIQGLVYNVGPGLDFDDYTTCIRALQGDDRPKTIYIHSGTYDIFTETGGAAYWTTITDPTLNWRDVCDVIPPNTTIIGKGDVVLQFAPAGTDITSVAADLVSPVNISGTCTLENVTVVADNCRYGIHDETSGLSQYTGAVKKYKNVNILRYSTDSVGSHRDAYACGFDDEMQFEYENCNFYVDKTGSAFRFHDRSVCRCTITANNSVFDGGATMRSAVRLEDVSYNSASHTKFTMANCYLGGRVHELDSSPGGRNPFDITLLNCSNVPIQIDTAVNPYPPKVYTI